VDTTATYACCWCGEESVTEVDVSQGMSQRYIEDCQVCCRPMIFFLTFDDDTLEATIATEPTD
jgi:hypothetical protein